MHTITIFDSIYQFSTARMYAKKLEPTDLEKLILMDSNFEVMKTLGGTRTLDQTKSGLESNLKHWIDNQFGAWMFYLKETNEWVGRTALRHINIDNNNEIEIAYALLPQFWNKGLATEMAKALCEIAFEVLRFDNVVSFTLTTNQGSRHVMEKAGFIFEKNIMHAGLPHVFYRRKNIRRVEISTYDHEWLEFYNVESQKIKTVLGDELKTIYHIGSTAIPYMSAKPIIDIMLECDNLDKISWITARLNTLNYYNIRRHVIPHRSFFTRREDKDISYHLHIRERGDPQIKRHVNFRDYLIAHPQDAQTYADLKLKLAALYPQDINSYVVGKDKLVQEIDTRAKLWIQRKNDYLPPNTGPLAKDWNKEKLIKAMESNFNVHMTHFAQYLNQVELIRIPGFTIVNTGLSDDTLNSVLEADFSAENANQKIHEITHYFKQKNIPFSWWLSPYDKPDNLEQLLIEKRYVSTKNNIALSFDLDAWEGKLTIPSELEIIRAKDETTLLDFASIPTKEADSFKKYFSWIASILTDDDPVEYYVGYVQGKPVVRELVCYFAEVAGLYWLSTTNETRQKEYDCIMQQFCLKRAKELGYHVAVLQTSSKDYTYYQKLGYKEYGIFKEFKLKNSQ